MTKHLSLTSKIRLCAIALIAGLLLPATGWSADSPKNFFSIFNGESFGDWTGDRSFWRVEDGHIIGETTAENPTPQNTFLIWRGGQPKNFELRLRYRIDSDWANSGIQVRSRDLGKHVVSGPQPDIATTGWITGIHFEERGRGVLARRGQKTVIDEDGERETTRFAEEDTLAKKFDQSEWTDYHIIAIGDTIITNINGHKMHQVVDRSPEAPGAGIIALQLHTGDPMTIRFKDIQIKILDQPASGLSCCP